jgi:long-chain acyl-CoA synthetase
MTATEPAGDALWGTRVVRRGEGVPFLVYEPRPQSMLMLLDISGRWPARTAFVHDDERLTYAQLGERVLRGAAILAAGGMAPGDRVLLLGANSIGWVVAFWATLRAGGIVVLGNGWWSAGETAHAIDLTTPAVVLADERGRTRLPAGTPAVMIEGLGTGPGATAAPALPVLGEDEPAMIQFTSGSTGAPKGAVLSHRSLIANQHMLLLVSRRLPHHLPADEKPEVTLQTGPLFHVGGIQGMLRAMLTGGTTVFLRRRFDAGEVLELIERERIRRWGGAPTMVSRVLAHPDMATRDLSSLTNITLGGAPVPVELAAEIQARFPAASRGLSQVYGMSEAGGTLCAASGRASAERPGVTGRPLPLVELRIAGPDADGIGEVLARTPTQMTGYWGGVPDDHVVVEDGWLRTGDLGRLDADGYLYITGRSKDVIIRGGENIAVGHVEATLLHHPAIGEAAVVGLPDPDLGEIVAAMVVPRAGAAVTATELQRFVAGRLAHFEVPARWWVTAEPLPVNAAGKIDKPAIRARWGARNVAGRPG